jgi:cell division protease FtsH
MSKKIGEVDTDADILHENSKKISIIDIKKALNRKFKPEQIARLGNNHVIYPSLSKKSFKELIQKKLEEIKSKFIELSSIDIEYDNTVYSAVYQNGVFPTQGVRPLFSTINLLVENIMPDFLLKALEDKSNNIKLSIDVDSSHAVGSYIINGHVIQHTKKVNLVINELKKKIDMNSLAVVAAHEVGHAVAYMHNLKVVPIQICGNGVSNSDGFVVPHIIEYTKDLLYKKIQIFLAGKVAEEIIFEDSNASAGCAADLNAATSTACDIVRDYNMHDTVGVITPSGSVTMQNMPMITNEEDSNDIIERLLTKEKTKTIKILRENKKLMKVLITAVLKKKELLAADIYELSKPYIKGLKLINIEDNITYEYHRHINEFLKSED